MPPPAHAEIRLPPPTDAPSAGPDLVHPAPDANNPMASHFLTDEEHLHFRRVTSLLSSPDLKPLAAEHASRNPGPPNLHIKHRYSALHHFAAFANLLVRGDEVVAVMPQVGGTHSFGGLLAVATSKPESNLPDTSPGFAAPWLVARNFRRAPAQGQPLSSVAPLYAALEKRRKLPGRPWEYGWGELPDTFEDHFGIIADMLMGMEPNRAEKFFKQEALCLHLYVLRACLSKILRRAGYHSSLFAQGNQDYSAKLPLARETWNMAMDCLRERFRGNHEILQHLWAASAKIKTGFSPNVDWNSSKGLGTHIQMLQSYEPNAFENNAIKMLYEERMLADQCFPGPGFYMNPRGRKLYHDVFTLYMALSLTCLKTLEHFHKNGEVTKALDPGAGSLLSLVLLCEKFMRYLDGLVSYCPLLLVHLTWFLRQQGSLPEDSPARDQWEMAVDDKREGLAPEESTDLNRRPDDDNEEEEEEEKEEADILLPDNTASNRRFPDGAPAHVRDIVRWLRLLTLYQNSIKVLLKSDTLDHLRKLNVNLVSTSMPHANNSLQSADQCVRMVAPELAGDPSNLILKKLRLLTDHFNGTYHCETILASLCLVALDPVLSKMAESCVPDLVRAQAAKLSPGVCAVSKACCPTCTVVYQVLAQEYPNKSFTIIGMHDTFSACDLPPWLPRTFAMQVVAILQERLKYALTTRYKILMDELRRGTPSPISSICGDADMTDLEPLDIDFLKSVGGES